MLAEIEARLDAQVSALKLVAGAAAFAALKTNPPKNKQPAAYVIPLAEAADGNTLINALRQRVVATVGISLATGSFKDARGAKAVKDIEALRAQVRTALLGWAPTAADDPLEFVRGDLVLVRDGVVWWQDRYRTAFQISAT